MKQLPTPYSRKLRQFRYHAKRLNRLLDSGGFSRLSVEARDKWVEKLKRLHDFFAGRLLTSRLKNILAGAAFLLTASTLQEASGQSFLPPVTNPFGLVQQSNFNLPAFADIDNDGDQDLFVGTYNGAILFYEDTSSTNTPAYDAPVTNPFGFSAGYYFACMAFVDIDNDGDLDMFHAEYYGNIQYYQNTGTATAPAFATAVTNPFGITAGYNYNMPAFVDIDNDGDYDLFATEYYANVRYFQNTGTAAAPAFTTPVNSPFGLGPPAASSYLSFPRFADIDGDSDYDAFFGDISGNIYYFPNNGTQTMPSFGFVQPNPFGLSATAQLSALDLADVDNDGDLDLYANSGTYIGGNYIADILFFENTGPLNNVPPVVSTIGNQMACEGDTLGPLAFTATDPNNDPVNLAAISSNMALIPNGNIQIMGAAPNFTLTAIPLPGQTGMTDITVVADDGTDTTRMTFNVMVSVCNDPPVITQIGTQTICDGDTLGPIPLTALDPDNDPFVLMPSSSNQTLLQDNNIFITGTAPNFMLTAIPNPGQTGIVNISITTTDGINPPVVMTFGLAINICNTPPVISPLPAQTVCDGDTLGPVPFTVNDVDGDPLTVTAITNNQSVLPDGNVTIAGTAPNYTLTGLTIPGQSGTVVITVTATDGNAQVMETMVVQINDCNNAPLISTLPDQMICVDESFGPLSFTVTDADGDPVTVSAFSNNQVVLPDMNLVITGTSPNFTIEGTPQSGQAGAAEVTIFATDGTLTGDRTFDVTVDVCGSISDEDLLDGFALVPVPVADVLEARWESPEFVTFAQVIDLQGRILVNHQLNGVVDKVEFRLKDQPAGIYFVRLGIKEGMVTRKFIKQ